MGVTLADLEWGGEVPVRKRIVSDNIHNIHIVVNVVKTYTTVRKGGTRSRKVCVCCGREQN